MSNDWITLLYREVKVTKTTEEDSKFIIRLNEFKDGSLHLDLRYQLDGRFSKRGISLYPVEAFVMMNAMYDSDGSEEIYFVDPGAKNQIFQRRLLVKSYKRYNGGHYIVLIKSNGMKTNCFISSSLKNDIKDALEDCIEYINNNNMKSEDMKLQLA
jgi:hypothetical protein